MGVLPCLLGVVAARVRVGGMVRRYLGFEDRIRLARVEQVEDAERARVLLRFGCAHRSASGSGSGMGSGSGSGSLMRECRAWRPLSAGGYQTSVTYAWASALQVMTRPPYPLRGPRRTGPLRPRHRTPRGRPRPR